MIFGIAMTLAMPLSALADSDVSRELSEQMTPDGWDAVQLPKIATITAANTLTITDYGASTSSEDNTLAIQKALDAVPAAGGMVVIPKGTWMCGPLKLKSKTVLHLAKGAMLKVLPLGTYPGSENYMSLIRKVSLDNFIDVYNNATDIIVEGEDNESSIIEGQGAPWWELRDKGGAYKKAFGLMKRGAMIRFTSGHRFLVRNLRIQNAPGVNCTIGNGGKGDNGTVHDIVIRAPKSTLKYRPGNAAGRNPSHNTDGIPMWAAHINIYNCDISTGDDNVVVDKNGQYIHVWDCDFGSGHGASIGSYTQNVHDIIYEDIRFNGTESGFKIKSQKGRSGSVHDIIFRNSTMKNVAGNVLSLDCWYDGQPRTPQAAIRSDSTATTPYYHDILFQNITSTGTPYKSSYKNNFPVYIFGLPESNIRNITFDNVQVSAGKGMFIAYAQNVEFTNGCKITNTREPKRLIETKYNTTVKGSYDGSETTGIAEVKSESQKKGDEAVYDIAGHRLYAQGLHRGIYIKSGKKFIVH